MIKDLEIVRLSWTIWVDPVNHKNSYKTEAEGDLTTSMERWQCDNRPRDWTDVVTGQEVPAASRSWKGEGTDSLRQPTKGASPGDTDFSPVRLLWNSWSPELFKRINLG